MKKALPLLIALALMTALPAAAATHGRDGGDDGKERPAATRQTKERDDVFSSLMRIFGKTPTQEAEAQPAHDDAATPSAPASSQDKEANTTATTTPAVGATSGGSGGNLEPATPSASVTENPVAPADTTSAASSLSHNGSATSIYADEGPLSRTQSGILFAFALALALAGLLLAERESLGRLLRPGPLMTSPLSEKRTALP